MLLFLNVLLASSLASSALAPAPVGAAGAISYGPAASQVADLYAGPEGAPVLVWVTGGGWMMDTVFAASPFAQGLANRGATVMVPHYTTRDPAAALADVAQAVAWADQVPGRGPLIVG